MGPGGESLGIRRLDIQVSDVKGVVFNELPSRFDLFAHQRGEYLIGAGWVLDHDFQESPCVGIHGGIEELRRIHFPETFIPLDR